MRILGAFLLCSLLSVPAAAQPVGVAYVFSDGNLPGTLQAYKALLRERPELRDQVSIAFLTESLFEEVDPAAITGADVVILDTMNQEMLDRFNTVGSVDLIADVSARGMVLAVGEGLAECRRLVLPSLDRS